MARASPDLGTYAMTKGVCTEPGCPEPVDSGRCDVHRSAREQQRGSRQARGYGVEHERLRAHYQSLMDAGHVFTCWRCGKVVYPHSWDLGHCDDDRRIWHGPEHPGENRATSGRVSACPHPSHGPPHPLAGDRPGA